MVYAPFGAVRLQIEFGLKAAEEAVAMIVAGRSVLGVKEKTLDADVHFCTEVSGLLSFSLPFGTQGCGLLFGFCLAARPVFGVKRLEERINDRRNGLEFNAVVKISMTFGLEIYKWVATMGVELVEIHCFWSKEVFSQI